MQSVIACDLLTVSRQRPAMATFLLTVLVGTACLTTCSLK